MMNLLTIDVEEWFHTSALEPFIGSQTWDRQPSRVARQTQDMLDLLEAHQTRATFFVLGWVAERFPQLVRDLAARGHEIASHGYRHRLIYHLSPETFRDYTVRSKAILEDLTGKPVLGYRATSFSVVRESWWALDIIREAGFVYDSSMFPIRHDIYGVKGIPRQPFLHDNGLIEIPLSTLNLMGMSFPIGGGGYFRLYPYWLTRAGLRSLNRQGFPTVVYLHPWELDPRCPRITQADWRTRFRQYLNLHKARERLARLLSDFQFISIREYLPGVIPFLKDPKGI